MHNSRNSCALRGKAARALPEKSVQPRAFMPNGKTGIVPVKKFPIDFIVGL